MKYENFKEVKSLVEQIDKINELISDINGDNVSISIIQGSYTFITIGTFSNCEHEAADIARNFIMRMKEFYISKMNSLTQRLSEL